MLSLIIEKIISAILIIIQRGGYLGIVGLMIIQSLNIPIPSEVIMPFSGFLASQGVFNFWFVVLCGAIGNLVGGYLSYMLAAYVLANGLRERSRVVRTLISDKSLNRAQIWFEKYGSVSVLIGRIVPIVNTFISFPAGMAKMKMRYFLPFTFIGAMIWSYILAKLGFILGENWPILRTYFKQFDNILLIVIAAFIAVWIWKRFFKKESLDNL